MVVVDRVFVEIGTETAYFMIEYDGKEYLVYYSIELNGKKIEGYSTRRFKSLEEARAFVDNIGNKIYELYERTRKEIDEETRKCNEMLARLRKEKMDELLNEVKHLL